MLRILILFVSALTILHAQDRRVTPVGGRRRVALVIGNRNYARNPLSNPLNDAQDMQRSLSTDGFQVTVATDTTLKNMQKSIREFGESVRPGDVALFYYSGHGLQVRGVNYLLPIDFAAQSDDAVPDEAYPAQRVQELLEQAGARFRILILDACRDNPLPSSKSLGSGLAPMNGGEGTYVVFATAENTVASDNPGQRNGLFTKHLLEMMNQPGLTLDQVLKETKRRVAQESRNLQRPWIYSDSTDDFYFRPGASPAAAPKPKATDTPQVSPDPKIDVVAVYRQAWDLYQAKKYPAALELYRQAAEAGDPAAAVNVGQLYEHGLGVESDEVEAMRWYRRAADAGNVDGIVGVAYLYDHTIQVDAQGKPLRNRAEAIRWYRMAAEKGYGGAMLQIGYLTSIGDGVEQSNAEALRWYHKAADAGNAGAMANIGRDYEEGIGVPKNLSEAISWYKKGAAGGSRLAIESLNRLRVAP